MNHYVYVYIDPRNDVPFYVGAGHNGRDVEHLARCQKGKGVNPHFYNKLCKLHREGIAPIVRRLVDEVTKAEAFDIWEPFFIAAIGRKDLGTGPLCNMTDGGDGLVNLSPEASERQRAAVKEAHNRPEVKARNSAAQKEAQNRPEVKARNSAAQKEAQNRPEVKARNSAAQKEAQNRPEVKARRSATNNRPEVKARHSAATKEYMNRPGVKARHSAARKEYMNRPEVKARRSAAVRHRLPANGCRGIRQVSSRWQAHIRIGGKLISLGMFATKLDAMKAYNDAVDLYWNGDGYKNRIVERRVTLMPVAVERRSTERRVA
jgi:hypothetical protein